MRYMNRFVSIKFEMEQEKLILRTNTIINNSNMGNVAKKRWIYLLNRNRSTNIGQYSYDEGCGISEQCVLGGNSDTGFRVSSAMSSIHVVFALIRNACVNFCL